MSASAGVVFAGRGLQATSAVLARRTARLIKRDRDIVNSYCKFLKGMFGCEYMCCV
jgi:hypothetical protein